MTPEAEQDLLSVGINKHLRRGEHLDADVGIVMIGVLGAKREFSDGRHTYCALFHQGDLFDLRREARPRQGNLLAVSDVGVITFRAEDIDACCNGHLDVADALISQVREQFARLRDHCADLATKTPVERLVSVLFELRRWPETRLSKDGRDMMKLPIRLSDLANYIGVAPETVSRVFFQLKAKNLVSRPSPDVIRLLDEATLRQIANGRKPALDR